MQLLLTWTLMSHTGATFQLNPKPYIDAVAPFLHPADIPSHTLLSQQPPENSHANSHIDDATTTPASPAAESATPGPDPQVQVSGSHFRAPWPAHMHLPGGPAPGLAQLMAYLEVSRLDMGQAHRLLPGALPLLDKVGGGGG